MNIFGKRLKQARTVRGMSQSHLANCVGASRPLISMLETGRCRPTMPRLSKVSQTLGVSIDYLLGFVDDPTPTQEVVHFRTAFEARIRDLEVGRPRTGGSDKGHSSGDFKPVPSADKETILDNARSIGVRKFRRTWFHQYGLEPRHCCVIKVATASMEPTLVKGGTILINRASRRRRAERIYVIQTDGRLMIARARRNRTAGWQLVRDNRDKRAWPTLPWPADARIVGEVKWSARTFA